MADPIAVATRAEPDVLVVGGGLSGAGAAAHLASAGLSVHVLERDATPSHKVCGEFLTAEALDELGRLGIDVFALGAERVCRVRLSAGDRLAEARLPFAAAGLSRLVLDPAVRVAAERAGAMIILGARASRLGEDGVRLANGERLGAGAVLLATGKHRLRGVPRRDPPRSKDSKIGLKDHLRLSPAMMGSLRNTVELHLFPGGYAGLMPIGNGLCNLSLVVTMQAWDAAGRDPAGLMDRLCRSAPHLARRLEGAEHVFPKPLAIADIPSGYRVWADAGDRGAFWRVGDQAAVTPSMTGAGMAMALRGGRLAAARIIADPSRPRTGDDILRREFGRQIAWARTFERLLEHRGAAAALVNFAGLAPIGLSAASRLTRLPA